ncbi:MAG: NosD domain-containing protein, partial [Ignavibacterium sp.]
MSEDTVLDKDIIGSVEITTNNITLDCNNHNITGLGTGYGIYLSDREKVTIKNCIITNFSGGLYLFRSSSIIFKNSTTSGNYYPIFLNNANDNTLDNNIANFGRVGIELWNSSNNSLTHNTVNSNSYAGIYIVNSSNSITVGNIVDSNGFGIYPVSGNNQLITGNLISNNEYGLAIAGGINHLIKENEFWRDGMTIWTGYEYATTYVIENNTVNGKPLYFLKNVQNIKVPEDAGSVHLVGSSNVTVENLKISSTLVGIELIHTESSLITNNIINSSRFGIILWDRLSTNNRITNNTISNNKFDGILFLSAHNNIASKNIVTSNGYGGTYTAGIRSDGSQNTISDNDINSNKYGITLSGNYSHIMNNTISNNTVGIYTYSNSYSTFVGNTISTNNLGFYLSWSTYSKLYHNNFITNQGQIKIKGDSFSFTNLFDDGYPSGGNYWSDYTGVDGKSGPNQDQPGADGIGDSPYCFYGGCDRYPFMRESGWEAPKIPEEFWVEVREDGECIYQEESLTTKLKCLPQGWVLKVANPQRKSWEGIPPITQIEDVTDGVSGWTKKEFLNYDSNKQIEWKEKIKKIASLYYNLSKNFEFKKDLQLGNEGEDIAYLQIILKEEIGDPIYPKDVPATGYFGSITERALKSFQEKYGIAQTGVV